MNLLILFIFAVLSSVHGIYKIPKYDACVLRVLLCDDFIKPLTPTDNSTVEMFKSIEQLNTVCNELQNFRLCLKSAEIFCSEQTFLNVGHQLLKNRQLAFDLCDSNSYKQVYLMVEKCVNKFSPTAIHFCTDKAVEVVGLNFSLSDYESECRFLGIMQHCHIAVVRDQCGNIAGNMLEKLVVFRGERDFLCTDYETKRLSDLEAYNATMDSYIQQYKNIANRIEMEEETETIDELKNENLDDDLMKDQTSSKFQSRISPMPEDCSADGECASSIQQPFNTDTCIQNWPLCYGLFLPEKLDSNTYPYTAQYLRNLQADDLSENHSCNTKASFLITGYTPSGKLYHLGWGEAYIVWYTHSPLNDISCGWMKNFVKPLPLAKCSILIDHSLPVGEICKGNIQCDFPTELSLAVYENENEPKKVAELKVHSFFQHSSVSSFYDKVLYFFQEYGQDIRNFCSDQHQEKNRARSTRRTGLMSSENNDYGMVNEQSETSDPKYNFYKPERTEHAIDTEIHFISPENEDEDSELKVEDSSESESYNENLNPSSNAEILEKNFDELSTIHPSISSEFSSHSYRPYELFRPRIGETLEADYQDISSPYLQSINTESNINLNALSTEDADEHVYMCESHLNTEEVCLPIPENISILDKLIGHYKGNCMNMDDPLDAVKDSPLGNMIYTVDEPQIIADDQQIKTELVYVVTLSSEIETPSIPIEVVNEDSDTRTDSFWTVVSKDDIKNLDEAFEDQQLNNEVIYLVFPSSELEMSIETNKIVNKNENYMEKLQALYIENGSQDAEDLVYQQIENEGFYVITPSTNIDMSNEPDMIVHEDLEILNFNENSQTRKTKDNFPDIQDLPNVNTKDLNHENDSSTKSTQARNSKAYFLELISNYENNQHPFSYKFIRASANNKTASEEFSPKMEIFSKRSNQIYRIETEEKLFNAFEVLAKIKVDVRRIRNIIKEARMVESNMASRRSEL